MAARREYIIRALIMYGTRLGCRTLVVFKGAGFDFDAQPSEALLRPGRSPLRHIQLLPAAAAFGNCALARPLCENSRSSAFQAEIPAPGIRCDARACSPAAKRTRREQSV